MTRHRALAAERRAWVAAVGRVGWEQELLRRRRDRLEQRRDQLDDPPRLDDDDALDGPPVLPFDGPAA